MEDLPSTSAVFNITKDEILDTSSEDDGEVNIFSNFCWKDSFGRGVGEIPNVCDADKELLTLGLCYDKCPIGMKRDGLGCHSVCPTGYEDQGLFCRKSEYTRDVGTIPDICPSGKSRIGSLCYSTCPTGTVRVGTECHSVCPQGFRDDGLYCRKEEYGRGAGYAAWDMDKCISQHGNCEWDGAMIYPTCDDGYSPFGCCICRPTIPNCAALGLGDRFDLSCAKKVTSDPTPLQCRDGLENVAGLCYSPCKTGYEAFGSNICRPTQPDCEADGLMPGNVDLSCAKVVEPVSPTVPASCPAGLEMDAGLCYSSCGDDKYFPVGPVCWSKAPEGWEDCGAGSAKTLDDCATITTTMVTSTFGLIGEIMFFGLGIAQEAKETVEGTLTAGLKSQWSKFAKDTSTELKKDLWKTVLDTELTLADGTIFVMSELGNKWENITAPADIMRVSSKIGSLATGLIPGVPGAGIVSAGLDTAAAFSYPLCSTYFPDLKPQAP